MKKNKVILLLLLTLIFASCGGAKYKYYFEKGKNANFNNGKWILNEPLTNYKNNNAYLFAKNGFEEILGDSLVELIELRQTKLVSRQLPLKPTEKELKQIKQLTGCDYLINIESRILKNEMGSMAHTTDIGKVTKYNEASTTINIFDLNSLEMISEATSIGEVKVTKTSEDKGFFETFDYTASGMQLAIHSIKKLIQKYDKYKKE